MTKRRFLLVILTVCLLSALCLCWWLVDGARVLTQQVEYRLLDSFQQSIENTAGWSQAARQIAAVFHTQAQAVLLDAAGEPVVQTQEFLLLRGKTPTVALLPALSDAEREKLRTAASKDEAESRRILQLASAFRYEAYIYGDVVYPSAKPYAQESKAVTTPVALEIREQAAADVVSAMLLPDAAAEQSSDTLTSNNWLPYLREEPVDTARLLELTAGAKPKQSLLRWEHLGITTVPEALGASQLAVYTVTHPLWDAIRTGVGNIVVWLVCTLILAAALALGIDRLARRKKS